MHILLTGGSSGIGFATTRLLLAQGHTLSVVARREENVLEAASGLEDEGARLFAIKADLLEPNAAQEVVKKAQERFGKIDVLINNAGMDSGGNWLLNPAWQDTLALNLLAAMALSRLVLKDMLADKHGQIISVASVAGHVASSPLYSASKFGLRGFSLALRRELLGSGVAVSVVSPGFIRTPMTAKRNLPMPGPDVVARVIADVLKRPRAEVIVPWYYRLLITLSQLFPTLTDFAVKRLV